MLERAQDWRLDAIAAAALAAKQTARGPSWTFRGLDALAHDSALFDALLRLLTDTLAEDPVERVFLPIHPDSLRRSLRAQRDGVIALADGRLNGLIAASTHDVVPDALRLNMILVRPDQRRQGLASALLASLLARHPGAAVRLVAPAAAGATAWIANRGFVRVADRLVLERLLCTTVAIAPALLDEYAGQYVVTARPGEPIVIERHGESLISKTRDMRDLVLPFSESEFFTRHHEGRGRFERDETGRVARLVIREGPREFIATRT
jgi:GNAT superfamily N-acetyltransferase